MTLAVTGATGHLGGLVVEHLLRRGTPADQIVALVRRPDAADHLAAKGVTVRVFDYNQPDELAPALTGVDSLLLVSGNEFGKRAQQHQAVIDAAKAAGVGRLVYTSAPGAETSISPVAPEH
ncbi:MAG TPA: NAD(P)-dependent oxidoreductase, partial [Propionibacteriaceae bacterium]|nr:NAD(P)-dependent oxidoreductase [Propionibacteriaceae bacterium]